MKVTQKKIEEGSVRLDAVASAEDVDRAFGAVQIAFAQQMGLRPEKDKTVAQAAAEKLGIKDLDSVVAPQVVEYLVPFAVDKKDIVPAFPPTAEPKGELRRGAEYAFSVNVTVKPDYELTSYDPVSITVPPFALDPAEVEAQIAQIAEQYAEYVTDDPHPVATGDSCLLSIEATQNGERMAGLSTEGRTYTAGQGYMPEGFDENIVGMDVGETKTFTFEGPSLDDKGKEITETVECKAKVIEVQKRVIPAINDAWVAKNMPMYRDAAALRGSIEENLSRTRKMEYDNYVRQVAASELAKRFEGRIADPVYEAMQNTMMGNLRAELQQQQMTFEQFVEQNGGEQQFQMMMMMQIRQTLVQGYSLDAVFRHEKMVLADEDFTEACMAMNPQNPRQAREQLEQSGRGFALREVAERMKANKWIVEKADITVAKQ